MNKQQEEERTMAVKSPAPGIFTRLMYGCTSLTRYFTMVHHYIYDIELNYLIIYTILLCLISGFFFLSILQRDVTQSATCIVMT